MGILPYGGRNGGGGTTGGGDLRLPPPEQSCTVHCDQAHYVPVSVGGATNGATGIHAEVETGRVECGGDADGGSGGGTEKGTGGDGQGG